MSTVSKSVEITPPLQQSAELVVQNLEDELLIYNLQTNQAICLNQTAALVWQNCDGKSGVSEIKQKLEKELGASVSKELVLFAISELNEKGLLENGEQMPNKFEGLSRREIVRKVGFASLVALPIVSLVVAPKAADAQSPFMSCIESGRYAFHCRTNSYNHSYCMGRGGSPCNEMSVDPIGYGTVRIGGTSSACCSGMVKATPYYCERLIERGQAGWCGCHCA